MFRRRIYYNVANGECLYIYSAEGDIRKDYPAEQEADALGLTNWGVLEWTEPDTEIEAAFAEVDADGKARTVSVTVDLSGSEPQLSFTYAPVEDPTERDDPYAIIDILTGEG